MANIKKIFALVVGLFVLGGTFAIAQDTHTLENYPEPFLSEGKLNGLIVIGTGADSSDVLGAVDIGADLQAKATTNAVVEIDTPEPYVTGGKSEKVTLGTKVKDEIGAELEENDVNGLKDGEVKFDGEYYDFHEIVSLSDDLKVVTSLSENDEDYKDGVFMEIREGAIIYTYKFDDNINLNDVTEDDELTLEFLGKTLEIVDVADNSITVQLGKEIFINQGEVFTFEDGGETYKIELKGVSSDSDKAHIAVNDEQKLIELNDEAEVDGIDVRVKEAFSNEDGADFAVLIVGSKTRETYDDGDAYIGEDKNDPEWVWTLDNLLSNNKDQIKLGVRYELTKDSADDKPAAVGECYSLPNDYLKLCLNSLTEKEYSAYSVEFDDSYSNVNDVYSGKSNEPVFVLKSKNENGFKMNSGEESDEIVLWVKDTENEIEVFYMDKDDNDLKSDAIYSQGSGTKKIATIEFGDTSMDVEIDLPLDLTNHVVMLKIVSPLTNDNIEIPMTVNGDNNFVGLQTPETSESNDLMWNGNGIGTRDENALTAYGLKLFSPDSNTENDRVKFEVPASQVEANVVASGVQTKINELNVKAGVHVNEFKSPVAKLDEEVLNSYQDYNVIVVGGPCANNVAKAILGTKDNCTDGFTKGTSMIKFIKDTGKGKSALIVAGYSALDTRNAAHALVNARADFKGTEITVFTKALYSYTMTNNVVNALSGNSTIV